MTDANKAIVHHWFDRVWNRGDEAAIDELLAPNVRTHGFAGPGSVTTGRDAFKEGHRLFHSAFSDIHVKLHHVIAEGNHVSAHWTATMKHTGDTLGFPATGKDVAFEGSSFTCIHNGQIVEGWNHMDFTHVTNELQAAALTAA
ncbi:MAG: ester cyclase [Acidobacteriota bacterium]